MDVVACRWCGSKTSPFPGPPSVPEWPRYRCSGCGTIAYRDLPDNEALAGLYRQGWADEDAFFTGVTANDVSQSLLTALAGRARPLGKVLDFGAGKGAFSAVLAQREGTQVTALEPYGPKQDLPGVTWLADPAEAAANGPYDAIFMIEVIEHLLDPVATMTQARELLAPNGRIYLSTPNARSLSAARKREHWHQAQNPTHINLFSERSISICMARAGLSPFCRSRRTVRFNRPPLAQALIMLTQLLGVDGGLRGSVGLAPAPRTAAIASR